LVFSENQYIEGFNPPRVFKVDTGFYKLNEVYWDNDLSYCGKTTRDIQPYKNFASKTIPKTVIFPKHFTWLNDKRSKNKTKYQIKHFGHCGYKWNETENKLEFDLDFYKKHNIPVPEVKNC
jgi:hypothetical protein